MNSLNDRLKIVSCADAEGLAASVAERIATVLRRCISEKGAATLALSGGRTPGAMMTLLGGADLDWSRVKVTLTDERCVPSDHPRSNAKLIGETLMQGKAKAATFVPLWDGADSLSRMQANVTEMLPLDVAVFGMGEDWHTASLFPGARGTAAALTSDCPVPLMQTFPPDQPEARVTLTAPVIGGAALRLLLLVGAEKLAAFQRALNVGDTVAAPVNILFADHGMTEIYRA